jgi:hypothetical protein
MKRQSEEANTAFSGHTPHVVQEQTRVSLQSVTRTERPLHRGSVASQISSPDNNMRASRCARNPEQQQQQQQQQRDIPSWWFRQILCTVTLEWLTVMALQQTEASCLLAALPIYVSYLHVIE